MKIEEAWGRARVDYLRLNTDIAVFKRRDCDSFFYWSGISSRSFLYCMVVGQLVGYLAARMKFVPDRYWSEFHQYTGRRKGTNYHEQIDA